MPAGAIERGFCGKNGLENREFWRRSGTGKTAAKPGRRRPNPAAGIVVLLEPLVMPRALEVVRR
jgi:hypothetical protein